MAASALTSTPDCMLARPAPPLNTLRTGAFSVAIDSACSAVAFSPATILRWIWSYRTLPLKVMVIASRPF
jgi:hypothetical protein